VKATKRKARKSEKVTAPRPSQRGPELFFGLIGAVGTDLQYVAQHLAIELKTVGYDHHDVRLSQLLTSCEKYAHLSSMMGQPEHERIRAFMDAGDEFRRNAERGDAVTLLAIGDIHATRARINNTKYQGDGSNPAPGQAYILNSLKHPDEVETLRQVYGSAFFTISVYESKDRREKALCEKIAKTSHRYDPNRFENEARELIDRDQKDIRDEFGQNVRDTFPKADLFLNAMDVRELEYQVRRFVQILFGYPFASPTIDEYSMFHARAASLRSVDLSRQVGAVIVSCEVDALSAGCNEVPAAGGGSVWECQIRHDSREDSEILGSDMTRLLEWRTNW
jgi:deoxycytidylate deaminase